MCNCFFSFEPAFPAAPIVIKTFRRQFRIRRSLFRRPKTLTGFLIDKLKCRVFEDSVSNSAQFVFSIRRRL